MSERRVFLASKIFSYLHSRSEFLKNNYEGIYCEENILRDFFHGFESLGNLMKWLEFPAGIYLFKVNNRKTRARCEIC